MVFGRPFRVSATLFTLCAAGVPLSVCRSAQADIDPLSGIDFVTVGAVGNAPWAGDGTPDDQSIGRGSVGYEYRIGKFEITTAQYVEFLNAAFDRAPSDWIPHLFAPGGAGFAAVATTPNTPGGRRWLVPAGKEMNPVGATDWRSAAIYCNWLHNNKGLAQSAFLSGAYDVSTFGYITLPNGVLAFTDQAARSPNARYFIPTLDEWIKAAHYDPQKVNSDGSVGGYWTWSNTSNTPYIGAPPPSMGGGGTANFGFDAGAFNIPLGAYTNVRSPWGLYDVAGGSTEWLETIHTINDGRNYRDFEGSGRTTGPNWVNQDAIYEFRSDRPNVAGVMDGFRVAAAIPTPATLVVMAAGFLSLRRRGGTGSCHRLCRCSERQCLWFARGALNVD
jgi:formylglycine-generating enzyme required for sulfatase activity